MHINVHYAIGMIIASISHFLLDITLIEFSLILACAFMIDFDVFLSKFEKNTNHRNLFTHSIWPGIILLIVGIIAGIFMQYYILIICGLTLIFHVLIDTLDWGVNLFFTGKLIGFKFLITQKEFDNIDEILSKYKVKHSFFVFRYYNNKAFIIIEISVFVLMVIINFLFALDYWYLMLLYFFFFGFHFLEYRRLKAIENK